MLIINDFFVFMNYFLKSLNKNIKKFNFIDMKLIWNLLGNLSKDILYSWKFLLEKILFFFIGNFLFRCW